MPGRDADEVAGQILRHVVESDRRIDNLAAQLAALKLEDEKMHTRIDGMGTNLSEARDELRGITESLRQMSEAQAKSEGWGKAVRYFAAVFASAAMAVAGWGLHTTAQSSTLVGVLLERVAKHEAEPSHGEGGRAVAGLEARVDASAQSMEELRKNVGEMKRTLEQIDRDVARVTGRRRSEDP